MKLIILNYQISLKKQIQIQIAFYIGFFLNLSGQIWVSKFISFLKKPAGNSPDICLLA